MTSVVVAGRLLPASAHHHHKGPTTGLLLRERTSANNVNANVSVDDDDDDDDAFEGAEGGVLMGKGRGPKGKKHGRNLNPNAATSLAPLQINGDRITSGHAKCDFSHVFGEEAEHKTVIQRIGRPLIDSFARGINAAIVFAGGGSVKWKAQLAGPDGMVPLLIEHIFRSIPQSSGPKISICSYEVYGESVFDLLASMQADLRLDESVEDGWFPTSLSQHEIKGVEACIGAFQKSFSLRKAHYPSSHLSAYFFRITLSQQKTDLRSVFHIVLLPAWQRILADGTSASIPSSISSSARPSGSSQLTSTRRKSSHTGPSTVDKRRGPHLFARFVEEVSAAPANNPASSNTSVASRLPKGSERLGHVSKETEASSALVKMTLPLFGNNANTAVLACMGGMDQLTTTKALKLCAQIRQIKNFPVVNNASTRRLLQYYRTMILESKHSKLGLLGELRGGTAFADEGRRLDSHIELLKLKDTKGKCMDQLAEAKKRIAFLEKQLVEQKTEALNAAEEKLLLTKAVIHLHQEAAKSNEVTMQVPKSRLDSAINRAHPTASALSAKEELTQATSTSSSDLEGSLEAEIMRRKKLESDIEIFKTQIRVLEEQLSSDNTGAVSGLDEKTSVMLQNRLSKFIQGKVGLLRERDALTEEIVELKGHPRSHTQFQGATEMAVAGIESQGRDILELIRRNTDLSAVGSLAATADALQKNRSHLQVHATGSAEDQYKLKMLERENAGLRLQIRNLEEEKTKMEENHRAFIKKQRSQLDKLIGEFAAWLSVDAASLTRSSLKDLASDVKKSLASMKSTFDEEISEAKARERSLQQSLEDMTLNFARLQSANQDLRAHCEDLKIAVPFSAKFELSGIAEEDEVMRLREEIHRLRRLKFDGIQGQTAMRNSASADDKTLYDLETFTTQTQRQLEKERSQLLIAKIKAEKKLELMEEFVKKKLKKLQEKAAKKASKA